MLDGPAIVTSELELEGDAVMVVRVSKYLCVLKLPGVVLESMRCRYARVGVYYKCCIETKSTKMTQDGRSSMKEVGRASPCLADGKNNNWVARICHGAFVDTGSVHGEWRWQ